MAKKPTYPRNEAKFIRVKDASDLLVVKEGSVWTYWKATADRDPAFGNDKYLAISDKVRNDLTKVMLRSSFDSSDKNDFPPYIPKHQREIQAKEIEEQLRQKELEKRTEVVSSSAPTANVDYNKWTKMNVPTPPSSPVSTPATGRKAGSKKAGTGSSFVGRSQADVQIAIKPHYENLSEQQTQLLFSLAYQYLHSTKEGVAKEWAASDEKDIHEQIENFIQFGLLKKQVPDELIPPLEILKKIPIIAADKELMYYFEKKWGAKIQEEKSVKFKNGLKFNTKALPTSLRLMVGAGKLAVKGGQLASSMIQSVLNKPKEMTDESFGTLPEPKKPSTVSDIGSFLSSKGSQLKESLTPSRRDTEVNKEALKMVGDGLKSIAKLLADKLPSKKAEDESVKAAQNVEGVDRDIAEPIKTATAAPAEKQKAVPDQLPQGGIFNKLLGFISGPFKLLGKLLGGLADIIKPLLGIFGRLGGALLSVLGKIGGGIVGAAGRAIGGIASAAGGLGAAGLVAAAGAVGYGAGTLLNKEFGLSDKLSDFAMKFTDKTPSVETQEQNVKMEEQVKNRMISAGVSADVVDKWTVGQPLPKEYTDIKQRERESRAETLKVASKDSSVSKSESLRAASKDNSTKILGAATASAMTTEAKQNSTTKQIIDATAKNNNVVAQQASVQRMFPRTQSSSLQKFLESRSVFA